MKKYENVCLKKLAKCINLKKKLFFTFKFLFFFNLPRSLRRRICHWQRHSSWPLCGHSMRWCWPVGYSCWPGHLGTSILKINSGNVCNKKVYHVTQKNIHRFSLCSTKINLEMFQACLNDQVERSDRKRLKPGHLQTYLYLLLMSLKLWANNFFMYF